MSWSERTVAGAATAALPPAGATRRRVLHEAAAVAAALTAAGAAGLAGGCGFELRVPPRLGFRSLALTGFDRRSPLAEDLRRAIGAQVALIEDANRAEVVLHSLADQRQRSVVASTATAQVRELQLRVRFEFRVATPTGRELTPKVELLLSRDMSYSETAALAKEQEEAELFRDMHADVVSQVMRRLASIRI
jgi:LPS-assembly lipoprotein